MSTKITIGLNPQKLTVGLNEIKNVSEDITYNCIDKYQENIIDMLAAGWVSPNGKLAIENYVESLNSLNDSLQSVLNQFGDAINAAVHQVARALGYSWVNVEPIIMIKKYTSEKARDNDNGSIYILKENLTQAVDIIEDFKSFIDERFVRMLSIVNDMGLYDDIDKADLFAAALHEFDSDYAGDIAKNAAYELGKGETMQGYIVRIMDNVRESYNTKLNDIVSELRSVVSGQIEDVAVAIKSAEQILSSNEMVHTSFASESFTKY